MNRSKADEDSPRITRIKLLFLQGLHFLDRQIVFDLP